MGDHLEVPRVVCCNCAIELERRRSDHQILKRDHNASALGLAVDPDRTASNRKREGIGGNGREQLIEELLPALRLRRVQGAPDAMLQLDHADRCESDGFRSESSTQISQQFGNRLTFPLSSDDGAGVEDQSHTEASSGCRWAMISSRSLAKFLPLPKVGSQNLDFLRRTKRIV